MKNILILTFVFFSISSYAQGVQIIENISFRNEKVEKFEYIDKNLDLNNLEKVIVLRGFSVNSRDNTLADLFNVFWKMSNAVGANSYFIDEVEQISDTIYVQITAYYLDDKTLENNFNLYPQNMVYVFGDLNLKKGKVRRIKINGQRIELPPLKHIEIQNEIGLRTTVSIGGFAGTRVDITGREGRLPAYFSFSGFSVGPALNMMGPMMQPGQVGISFNTGKIHPVRMNFGQFLINILTKKE